jgi:hypothetical protein
MNKPNTFLAVGIVLIFNSLATFSQEFKPIIKVAKGENYNYTSGMNMDINISVAGQEMKVTSSSTYTIKNVIDKVNADGSIDIINTTWDIKVLSSAMGKDSTINMEGKAGPTYKQQFDKLGNFVKKEIIDSSALLINIDNTSNSLSVFCEFPDKNLKPGDKWTKERTDSIDIKQMGGKMGVKGQTEYTFGQKEKIDGMDLIKVTFTATLGIGGKGNMMGMDIFMEGTGVSSGELYFDPATGVIYTNKGNIEMDINMAITGAQSMTMPMNQKITYTQKLVK